MRCGIGALVLAALAGSVDAQMVTVRIENMLDDGSFSFTPVWMGLHNGMFDAYDTGTAASPALEALAEGGDTSPISADFASSPAGLAGGVDLTLAEPNDAPVFGPGEHNQISFDPGDRTVNRWFSFASMIVPSNDLFMGNDDPTRYEIFDATGAYTGPVEILVFGRDINDAGTEVNDAHGGAAFSELGGDSIDEFVLIRDFFTDQADQDYLDSFIGTGTIDGGTITRSFGPDDVVARILVTPAPGAVPLLGIAGALFTHRRR